METIQKIDQRTALHIADPRMHEAFSVRASIITRLADLGRLDGAEATLIGITNDQNFESVSYGVFSPGEVAGIEGRFKKKLGEMMDGAVTVRATVRVRPSPKLLTTIDELPAEHRISLDVWPTSDPARHVASMGQAVARTRFAAQREIALGLRRPAWSIGEMAHRSDWPEWLPREWREFIKERSRGWLELQNAPAGFKEPVEAAPATSPLAATRHAPLPQNAGGPR